uniref:Uncharacterized protein n=1 Tax=Oryza rufipogon TaxID=4529 RepID=A0A0E0NWU2_ORYRU
MTTNENGFGNVLIGSAKVNVSRSFSNSDGAAGIGVVIQDYDGSSAEEVEASFGLSGMDQNVTMMVRSNCIEPAGLSALTAGGPNYDQALGHHGRVTNRNRWRERWGFGLLDVPTTTRLQGIRAGSPITTGGERDGGANYDQAPGHQGRVTNRDRWRERWGFGLLDV